MQDRYVGDVGDFLKFIILRALAPGYSLGVGWWLHPDEGDNGDGRHINYLEHPADWRSLDPALFDRLADIVRKGERQVLALEAAALLDNAIYHRRPLPLRGAAASLAAARTAWLAEFKAVTANCDLLFLDPDNGLPPSRFSLGSRRAAKSVGLCELNSLRREGRCIIIYHHQTRRAGGHLAELKYWGERLSGEGHSRVDAIRARPFSPRAFFLLDAPQEIRLRAAHLTRRCARALSWHPDLHATL